MACTTEGCGTGGWNGPLPGDPDNNSILTATPAFGGIDVNWTYPTTNPHALQYTVLYRGILPDFNSAVEYAIVSGSFYYDRVNANQRFYYWIKFVSSNGTHGDIIGPATALARSRIEDMLIELTDRIDMGVLAQSLKTEILKIPAIGNQITEETSSRLTENEALQTVVSQVGAQLDDSNVVIQNEIIARATAVSNLASQITTVQSVLGDDIASAQMLLQTNIDTVTGIVGALYTAKVNVNGLIGGFGLYNDGTVVQAGFDVDEFWIGRTSADKKKPFIIVGGQVYIDSAAINELQVHKITSGEMNSEWRINGANGRIVMDNGVVMKVLGTGFGANQDLIEWFGPSMGINQCTKANATVYLGLDGSAYYGGSLSAGVLYNARRTTQTAADAFIVLGPFASNGNPKVVVVSYTFQHVLTSSANNPNEYTRTGGDTAATIVLRKSFNGGAFVQVASAAVDGNYIIDNEPDGPDYARTFMSSSFTFTDTGAAGDYTYEAVITARTQDTFTHPDGSASSVYTQSLGVVSTEE